MTTPFPTKRVKSLARKIGSGKTPDGGGESYVSQGVTFLRSQNVYFDGLRLDDVVYVDSETDRSMSGTRVQAGDSLLNITGASLGRVTLALPSLGPANVNQHVCIVRPDSNIDPRFLVWSLQSHMAQQQILALQVGGNRDGLNFEQIGNLSIPVPSSREQRHIADFLDSETVRIDHLINMQIKVLDRLRERGVAVRDHLVDDLARRCGELPLRRFASRIEQGSSPVCENGPRINGEWAVLKLSSVKSGRFVAGENKRLPDDEEPIRRYEVRKGDLLVTRANTPDLVGDVAVATSGSEKLLLPDLIYRVSLDGGVVAEYVAQVALSSRVRQVIESTARGSSQSMVKLRGEDIKSWPIPAASGDQQIQLVEQIEREARPVSALREVIERQIGLLAERRQALITAAVTGEFDVTTARGFDPSGGVV